MCRQARCCTNSSSNGTGIAAVAVIAAGAIVVVKIGPIVARIVHLVVEVLTIVMLSAASALAAILLIWLTIRIVRWQAHRARTQQAAVLRPVPSEPIGTNADCLACGGTGTVLRAITGSRYQPQACPVCEPAQKAG
jgi:hypothetical protein